MAQIQINGETFDVFIVRSPEAAPIPILMDVAPRNVSATVSVASSASSVSIVAANTLRKGISIFNNSIHSLYLSYTTPATPTNSFMRMQPASLLLLDQQLVVSNAIYGIWTSVDGTAQVTEFE